MHSLKEKDKRKASSKGTCYNNNFEVSHLEKDLAFNSDGEPIYVAEYIGSKPNECQALIRSNTNKEKKKPSMDFMRKMPMI